MEKRRQRAMDIFRFGNLTRHVGGQYGTKPEPEKSSNGGVNPNNSITIISGIPNDGGDW